MFLGVLPDFIAPADTEGNGATLEVLDPSTVDAKHLISMYTRLLETHFPLESPGPADLAWAGTVVDLADRWGRGQPRMVLLQEGATAFVRRFLKNEDG